MSNEETNAVECLECVGLSFLQKEGQKPDATVEEIYRRKLSLKGPLFTNNYANSTKKIHGV